MGKLKELIESKIETSKTIADTINGEVKYTVRPVDPFTFIAIMEDLGIDREDLRALGGQIKLKPDQMRTLFLKLLELGLDDWEPGLERLIPHMIIPLGSAILQMSTYATFPSQPPRVFTAELGEQIQSQDLRS